MLHECQSVFAFIDTQSGAQSDYVIVKAGELAAMSQGLNIRQSVLIHGGVGRFAVQLAKARGFMRPVRRRISILYAIWARMR